MRAYIVITAESGKARDIARQVGSLPGVKMADACWGSRDIFAVVEVRESQELNKLVMDQIQRGWQGLERRARISPSISRFLARKLRVAN